MILEMNGKTTEQKLKSLYESTQLALNTIEAQSLQDGAIKAGSITKIELAERVTAQINSAYSNAYTALSTASTAKSAAEALDTMEWAISDSETVAPTTGWTTTMPALTTAKPYLWQRVIKIVNGVRTVVATPQRATTMDGLYVFMNNARDSSRGQTVIDGGSIITGTVQADSFRVGSTAASTISSISGTASTAASNASTALSQAAQAAAAAVTAAKTASNFITQIDSGGIKVHDANDTSNYAKITSDGMSIYQTGSEIAKFSSTELNIDATGIINFGDSGKYRILRAKSSDNYWMRIDSPRGLFLYGRGSDGSTAYNPAYRSKVIPSSGQTDQGACRWWSAASGVTGYFIGPSSSSKYLKSEIKPVEDFDCTALYELPVSQFLWNGDDNLTLGLIADDVAEKFPVATIYRENYRDGNDPADWNDRVIIAAMLKLIQEQHAEIETLKERMTNNGL